MAEPGNGTLEPPPYTALDTRRLHLRPLQVSDAAAILPIISREDVMQWTSQRPVTTIAQAERWLSDRALGQDVFNFAIELHSFGHTASSEINNSLIGVIGSFYQPRLGYLIHPGILESTFLLLVLHMVGDKVSTTDHAGKGYATEALRTLVPALFEHMPPAGEGGLGFDYLEACIDPENKASQRVLEKSGFMSCETNSQDFENPAFGLRDTVVFRIARPGKKLEELGLLLPKADGGQGAEPLDDQLIPPMQ